MSCIYKYKGKDYTKDEFYSLVRTTMVQSRNVQGYEKVLFPLGDTAVTLNNARDLNPIQYQKLSAEEKAKTIEQVTKEHRSITALKDLAHKLAHRIGGTVRFENHPNADWKGYNQGNTSVLNEAYMVTSKVVPINPNLINYSEIQYSKIPSQERINKIQDVEGFENQINNQTLIKTFSPNYLFTKDWNIKVPEVILETNDSNSDFNLSCIQK